MPPVAPKKIKIMASSPTTSWQIEGEKVQAVTDFIFLDSKITADGDSNQRTLAPWKESYENLDSILKSRDITLLTKVYIVKAMVFLVVRLPWWLRQKRVCLQCGRPGFDPWVGKILWRRKWQPTPVLLPGKSHGWRSLVGYSPWGHKKVGHD